MEILLIVIRSEQKLVVFHCQSLWMKFIFFNIFKWQIAVHILGPATDFDLKDYVVIYLNTAGKDLILLNNRDLWLL